MNTLKKLGILLISLVFFGGAATVLLWWLGTAGYVDLDTLLGELAPYKEAIVGNGMAALIGGTAGFTIRAVVLKIIAGSEARVAQMVFKGIKSNEEVMERQKELDYKLNLILEKEAIDSQRAINGRVAEDRDKERYRSWNAKVKETSPLDGFTITELMDIIPDEVEEKVEDFIKDKAEDVLGIVKGLI